MNLTNSTAVLNSNQAETLSSNTVNESDNEHIECANVFRLIFLCTCSHIQRIVLLHAILRVNLIYLELFHFHPHLFFGGGVVPC